MCIDYRATVTALCMWEHIVSTDSDSPWKRFIYHNGTNATRHEVLSLAPRIDSIFDDVFEIVQSYTWDWEIIPFIIELATYSDGSSFIIVPENSLLVAAIKEHFKSLPEKG